MMIGITADKFTMVIVNCEAVSMFHFIFKSKLCMINHTIFTFPVLLLLAFLIATCTVLPCLPLFQKTLLGDLRLNMSSSLHLLICQSSLAASNLKDIIISAIHHDKLSLHPIYAFAWCVQKTNLHSAAFVLGPITWPYVVGCWMALLPPNPTFLLHILLKAAVKTLQFNWCPLLCAVPALVHLMPSFPLIQCVPLQCDLISTLHPLSLLNLRWMALQYVKNPNLKEIVFMKLWTFV